MLKGQKEKKTRPGMSQFKKVYSQIEIKMYLNGSFQGQTLGHEMGDEKPADYFSFRPSEQKLSLGKIRR